MGQAGLRGESKGKTRSGNKIDGLPRSIYPYLFICKGDDDVDDTESKPNKNKRSREEFTPAEDGADGPMGSDRAFLKARHGPIDLESKVGKTEVINPTTTEGSTSAGFWCEVCACLLKDSASYLDHINGKKRKHYPTIVILCVFLCVYVYS